MMTNKYQINQDYLVKFADWKNSKNENSVGFISEIAENSKNLFAESKFPTTKDEEWRFTNISNFLKSDLKPATFEDFASKLIPESVFQNSLKNTKSIKLVFQNGFFNEHLSSISNLNGKVVLGSVDKISKEKPELFAKYFNKSKNTKSTFELLNNLFAVDGFFLFVPKNVVVEMPIEVINLIGNETQNLLVSTHNLIIVEENAEVKVIFQSVLDNSHTNYHNYFTEIFGGKSSRIEIYDTEESLINKIGTTEIVLEENSLFNHFSFSLSANFVRNNLNAKLNGEHIEAHFYGLYTEKQNEHVDNHTFINHAKPNCFTNEVYKGILTDNSKAVFSGKILVEKDSQKTNAYQSNKTILLSDNARIDTKPQLEIYADDVRCTHGATVGQLDKDSLFYIISRGIPKEIAQSMLIRAFLAEVIDAIKIPELREQINHKVFFSLNQREI